MGSGISWAICKSAPRARHNHASTPLLSFFTGRMPFLPPNQQRQSTEGTQPAGDMSHKPGGKLPLFSARPAVTIATLKRAATNFAAWGTIFPGTMSVNSLPKTVTRQRRDCDLNLGPSAPESSTLTTRLPSRNIYNDLISTIRWPATAC